MKKNSRLKRKPELKKLLQKKLLNPNQRLSQKLNPGKRFLPKTEQLREPEEEPEEEKVRRALESSKRPL